MDMRAELEKANYPIPDEAAIDTLSTLFNKHTDLAMPDSKSTAKWYLLFKQVDDDASGLITYDELHELVRKKKLQGGLGIPVKELNDKGLKALWCALDVDNSNSLTGLEFGRFMQRMGAGKLTKGASQAREELLKKKATERRLQVEKEQAQEIADQKLESSISTKEMRKQLEEVNMPLPGEKELDEMSKIFNRRSSSRIRRASVSTLRGFGC